MRNVFVSEYLYNSQLDPKLTIGKYFSSLSNSITWYIFVHNFVQFVDLVSFSGEKLIPNRDRSVYRVTEVGPIDIANLLSAFPKAQYRLLIKTHVTKQPECQDLNVRFLFELSFF